MLQPKPALRAKRIERKETEMAMIVEIRETSESNPEHGTDLAWKLVSRIAPALRVFAVHENLEIAIEVK